MSFATNIQYAASLASEKRFELMYHTDEERMFLACHKEQGCVLLGIDAATAQHVLKTGGFVTHDLTCVGLPHWHVVLSPARSDVLGNPFLPTSLLGLLRELRTGPKARFLVVALNHHTLEVLRRRVLVLEAIGDRAAVAVVPTSSAAIGLEIPGFPLLPPDQCQKLQFYVGAAGNDEPVTEKLLVAVETTSGSQSLSNFVLPSDN